MTDSFNVILNMRLPSFTRSPLIYLDGTKYGAIATHYREKDSCYYMLTFGGPSDSVPLTEYHTYFLWKIDHTGKPLRTTGVFTMFEKQDTSYSLFTQRLPSMTDVNDSLLFVSSLCQIQKGGFDRLHPIVIQFSYNQFKMQKWNIAYNNDLADASSSYQSIGFFNSSIQFKDTKLYQLTLDNYYQKFRLQKYSIDLTQHEEYLIPMPMADSFYFHSNLGFILKDKNFVTWGSTSGKPYLYSTTLIRTAVGEIQQSSPFVFYPNPVQYSFTIDLNQHLNHTLTLKDMHAKTILSQTNVSGKTVLNLPILSDGIYILEVTSEKGIQRNKILISQ
jgi:hypothetical protein